MKLYRIKHAPTGWYLVDPHFGGGRRGVWPHSSCWGPSGSLWKRIDTVARHLDRLQFDWDVVLDDRHCYVGMRHGECHPERMDALEVEIITVTVNSTETVPAAEFSAKRTQGGSDAA